MPNGTLIMSKYKSTHKLQIQIVRPHQWKFQDSNSPYMQLQRHSGTKNYLIIAVG